jgi:hypothetical protein
MFAIFDSVNINPSLLLPLHAFVQYFFLDYAWTDIQTRRKFFEAYAEQNGFDPLIPENWYPLTGDKIFSTHVRTIPKLFCNTKFILVVFIYIFIFIFFTGSGFVALSQQQTVSSPN